MCLPQSTRPFQGGAEPQPPLLLLVSEARRAVAPAASTDVQPGHSTRTVPAAHQFGLLDLPTTNRGEVTASQQTARPTA
jgi:hypothetical protein